MVLLCLFSACSFRLKKRQTLAKYGLEWECFEGNIRRALCGLEEGRFTDLALNVTSLLVLVTPHVSKRYPKDTGNQPSTYHLELRLGSALVLSSALALLLSLGTLQNHMSA
jgi:hypothetical protein